jgi:putative transposase
MADILGVSRNGYYRWKRKPKSNRAQEDDILLNPIKEIMKKGRGNYGSPMVTKILRNEYGIRCGKNRIARIMRENGIKAKTHRKFKATTNSKHKYPVAPNLLNQEFNVAAPNTVWVADITYIGTDEGWLYLAVIMDLYSRQIVGWAMDELMKRDLVLRALQQAVWRRNPPWDLIHHSDRGSQYASTDYQRALKKYGMKPSMSRKGDPYDNACAESFFATLKKQHVYFYHYATRAQARQSIFEYIEVFYNRIKGHSLLDGRSPVDFETLTQAA